MPDDPVFFDPITDDPWHLHLHAIGAITVLWNKAESYADHLLGLLGHFPPNNILLSAVGNVTKMRLLARLANDELDAEGIEAIAHFIKLFDRCRENRNVIMHSRLEGDSDPPTLKKLSSTGAQVTFSADLEALRDVARSMDVLLWYAFAIAKISGHRSRLMRPMFEIAHPGELPPPWPEKPPLPRKLDPLPPQGDQQGGFPRP